MNRARRRKMEKQGVVEAFDADTMFRMKYEIKVPGAILRSEFPSTVSGVIEARSEADLLRGAIVKLLDAYAYTVHDRAVAGVVAEVFNPLPKRLRGNIAFAIIEGLGLYVGLDDEEVCVDKKCGAVRENQLNPDVPEGFDPESDEPLPMLDVTQHTAECAVNRDGTIPAYKVEEVVVVSNPPRYEPLRNAAIDPETGDVTPMEVPEETGGEQVSTVDAGEDSQLVNEEDAHGEEEGIEPDPVPGE